MTTQLSGVTQQHLFANKDGKMMKDKNQDYIKIDHNFKFIILLHVYLKNSDQLVQTKYVKQCQSHTVIWKFTCFYEILKLQL